MRSSRLEGGLLGGPTRVLLLLSGLAGGCGSGAPLRADGGAGAGGHDAASFEIGSTAGAGGAGGASGAGASGGAGGASGAGGAGGARPYGYCDTFADCELRAGCCGSSCGAKADPLPASQPMCITDCAAGGLGAEPPTCGCVDHRCSNDSPCIAPGAGACLPCPNGYVSGPDGCATCACKPTDAGADQALPACTWPAALSAPDAGRGACRPARALLDCQSPNGVSEVCASDDPSRCAGDTVVTGASFTCHDLCGAHEYAVVCGSIGPGPIDDPPAGCHGGLASPGGTVFHCCPCL